MNNLFLPIVPTCNLNFFGKKSVAIAKQIFVVVGLILGSISGSATVYTVTDVSDGNNVNQLRGAILAADAAGGTHTINVAAGTYNLNTGHILFGTKAENITIVGAGSGSTIIIPNAGARAFAINLSVSTAVMSINVSGIAFKNANVNADRNGGGAIRMVGPNTTLTLTNCLFDNNKIDPTGTGSTNRCVGGAVRFTGGGSLSVDGCTFSNNIAAGNASLAGFGGAIQFEFLNYMISGVSQYPNCNVNITNSTFSGNSVGASGISGSSGGAIFIQAGGGGVGQTFALNMKENNFLNNTALGTNSKGGAIGTINSFAAGNTWNITYNRFVGNTATLLGSALASDDVQGNILATNNWWGCNNGPTSCADKAERVSGSAGGTLTSSPYLVLRTVAGTSTLCSGAATTITANFTTNSDGTSIAASDLTAFNGVPINFTANLGSLSSVQNTIQASGTATATFTAGASGGAGSVYAVVDNVTASAALATASITVSAGISVTNPSNAVVCLGSAASFTATGSGSGTLSYQWYKGTTALNNGATGTGSTLAGVNSNTLNITNAGSADAVSNYNVKVSSTTGCSVATSANASLTVNTLPGITDAPDATTVCAGATSSFTATASGSGTLSYQWFKGATQLANGATGNGSTISGVTASTLTLTNTALADAGSYSVRVSSSTGCTPANSTAASLSVNALPAIGTQPTNVATPACTGNAVSFTATASGSGTLSFQWYKGATALNAGPTGTGSTLAIVSTATASTLTINNPSMADNATDYNVKVSSSTGCAQATSNNASLTISAPATIASTTTTVSKNVSATNSVISDASCNLIAIVAQSGASPVAGNVSATVTVQSSVQVSPNGSPYVQRHYDIVPATTASSATLTLYFTQAEFTAFNTFIGNGNQLPINSTDAANNKANIRIYQFHGTGTAPGNYTGGSEIINPADNLIIYNSTYNRWEITFDVTSFSGFYLANTTSIILPLKLISFVGNTNGLDISLQWKTANETGLSGFEIERSVNGIQFTKIGQVAAGANTYQFNDVPTAKTIYYYRLKMIDKDGRFSYSYIVAVNLKKSANAVQVLPNPFTDKLLLNITSPQLSKGMITLVDMTGKVLLSKSSTLQIGTNALTLDGLFYLAKGTYILQVVGDNINETVKVFKE